MSNSSTDTELNSESGNETRDETVINYQSEVLDTSEYDEVQLSTGVVQNPRRSSDGSGSMNRTQETPFSAPMLLCFICLEMGVGENIECCRNFSCYNCFKTHINTQISGGHHQIACPYCDKSINSSKMLACLDEKTTKTLTRLTLIASLKKNEKLCPRCDYLQTVPMAKTKLLPSPGAADVKCPQCDLAWCFFCHSPAHEGITCREYQKPDSAFVEWKLTIDPDLNPNAQICPKCQIHIQRDGGCTHIKCTRCKTDFCYKCGRTFNRGLAYRLFVGDHYEKYGIVGCPTLLYPDSKTKRVSLRILIYCAKRLVMLPFMVIILVMVIVLVPFVIIAFIPVMIFVASAKLCCNRHLPDEAVEPV